jgi:hypothetical protein
MSYGIYRKIAVLAIESVAELIRYPSGLCLFPSSCHYPYLINCDLYVVANESIVEPLCTLDGLCPTLSSYLSAPVRDSPSLPRRERLS